MQIVVEVAEVWSEQATGTGKEFETAIEAHLMAQGEWSTLKLHFRRYLAVLQLYFGCPATFTFAFTFTKNSDVCLQCLVRAQDSNINNENLDFLQQGEQRLERIP